MRLRGCPEYARNMPGMPGISGCLALLNFLSHDIDMDDNWAINATPSLRCAARRIRIKVHAPFDVCFSMSMRVPGFHPRPLAAGVKAVNGIAMEPISEDQSGGAAALVRDSQRSRRTRMPALAFRDAP